MTNAKILRAVARRAVDEARDAWRKARASGTEIDVRAAMRACVFAARALRRAAPFAPGEHAAMLAAAGRQDAAAAALKTRLVEILETRRAVL